MKMESAKKNLIMINKNKLNNTQNHRIYIDNDLSDQEREIQRRLADKARRGRMVTR